MTKVMITTIWIREEARISISPPTSAPYATSKGALVAMTGALSIELAPDVRVNAVVPAATDTPMLRAGFEGSRMERPPGKADSDRSAADEYSCSGFQHGSPFETRRIP